VDLSLYYSRAPTRPGQREHDASQCERDGRQFAQTERFTDEKQSGTYVKFTDSGAALFA
jgi:hypothetical protein